LTKQPFFFSLASESSCGALDSLNPEEPHLFQICTNRIILTRPVFQICTMAQMKQYAPKSIRGDSFRRQHTGKTNLFQRRKLRKHQATQALATFLQIKVTKQLAKKIKTAIFRVNGRSNMKGKSITKNGVIRGLSQNETMQLSQLLTSMQKQRINDGDSVLVKTEYIVDSWKEYWLGKEQDEEQDY